MKRISFSFASSLLIFSLTCPGRALCQEAPAPNPPPAEVKDETADPKPSAKETKDQPAASSKKVKLSAKAARKLKQELVTQHPELATQWKSVPKDENRLLQWLELSEQMSGKHSKIPSLPDRLRDSFLGWSAWDHEAADKWLTENAKFVDRLIRIGKLPKASIKNLDERIYKQTNTFQLTGLILSMKVRCDLESGRFDSALTAIGAINALVDSLENSEFATGSDSSLALGISTRLKQTVEPLLANPETPLTRDLLTRFRDAIFSVDHKLSNQLVEVVREEWESLFDVRAAEGFDSIAGEEAHPEDWTREEAEIAVLHIKQLREASEEVLIADASHEIPQDGDFSVTLDNTLKYFIQNWVKDQRPFAIWHAALNVALDEPAPNDPATGKPFFRDTLANALRASVEDEGLTNLGVETQMTQKIPVVK